MINTKDSEKTAHKFFKKEKIVTLEQLVEILNCSRSTAQRRLKKLGVYRSYNKNGRYYVLKSSVKFDENQLWRYKGVLFSENGNLKQTIHAAIDHSEDGLSVMEISKLLGIKLGSFFSQAMNVKIFRRERIKGRFVHFSSKEDVYITQKQNRDKKIIITKTTLPKDMEVILILVEHIRYPHLSVEQLSKRLRKNRHRIGTETIHHIFEKHDLKKTMDIKS